VVLTRRKGGRIVRCMQQVYRYGVLALTMVVGGFGQPRVSAEEFLSRALPHLPVEESYEGWRRGHGTRRRVRARTR
jgi:hypothetical protein